MNSLFPVFNALRKFSSIALGIIIIRFRSEEVAIVIRKQKILLGILAVNSSTIDPYILSKLLHQKIFEFLLFSQYYHLYTVGHLART